MDTQYNDNISNRFNKLNILCIGDQHFKTNNIQEIEIFLVKLESYLKDNIDNIDIIISLGDLLDDHSRVHITPLNLAIKYIQLLTSFRFTYQIIGNHDAYSNEIFLSDNHWANCLKHLPNLEVVDRVISRTHKDFNFILCPFVPDGRFNEALNTIPSWKDAKCIFSHVTIRGTEMANSIINKDSDIWELSYPLLISGHIHGSQWVQKNMYYTGSVMQVNIDENPDKHIALLSVTSTDLIITEIKLDLPTKERIYLNINDLADFKVPEFNNTKYALIISGSYEEFKAFKNSGLYKELCKNPYIVNGSKGIMFKSALKSDILLSHIKERSNRHNKIQTFTELLSEAILAENNTMLTHLYAQIQKSI